MFFLKKIFQLRDHANPNAEKPFLEHLEDLRVCITRVVLTLLIATVACFVFRNELMTIIRRPIAQVWERGEAKALKESQISLKDWEEAKTHSEAFDGLPQEHRAHYLQQFDDPEQALETMEIVSLYRAARSFEDEKAQRAYIESHDGLSAALKQKLLALIDGQPNAKPDARGKLVQMQALKPTEGFMLSIKLAFFAGIVISFPFLLFFLLQFIIPGLHDTERKALWPALAVGFGLFLGGVLFAYFIVLPKVLEFFHTYSAEMAIENEWRIGYYISFATQFTLIFGVSFELPVVVMTLVRIGLLNSEMMRSTRAYAILAIFVVAAIITPTPDAFTLCLLAGPMVVLYEICIWLAYFLNKKQARLEEEEEKERMARLLALKERRAAMGGDEGDDEDPDGDHPGGGGPDHPDDPDPHHPTGGDHHEDPYHHDPHHHGYGAHDAEHDHDPEDYHYHTDDESFRSEHHQEGEEHSTTHGELGYGDDGHAGSEPAAFETPTPDDDGPETPSSSDASSDELHQEDFDFHEETDPALTEEGEQEDVSDPWPEEGEQSSPTAEEDLLDDIPEEERNREMDDPYRKDQD